MSEPTGSGTGASPKARDGEQRRTLGQALDGPSLWALGAWLVLGTTFLVYLLVALWPDRVPPVPPGAPGAPGASGAAGAAGAAGAPERWSRAVDLFFVAPGAALSPDVRSLLLVLIAGSLGGMLHALRSFAYWVGKDRFDAGWVVWYFLRAPIGALLALVFYLVLRGGLMTTTAGSSDMSIFGVTAIAALVGTFSEQALLKLKELADTLFKKPPSEADEDDASGGPNPVPEIASLSPAAVRVGTTQLSVQVEGKGFVRASTVRNDDLPRPTTFRSAKGLTFELDPADVSRAGSIEVTVVNPEPGGGESEVAYLRVTE